MNPPFLFFGMDFPASLPGKMEMVEGKPNPKKGLLERKKDANEA